MLVLLMEGVYEVHCWDGLRRHHINTKLHDDLLRHLSIIKVIIIISDDAMMLLTTERI
jgi:hypothetical protein